MYNMLCFHGALNCKCDLDVYLIVKLELFVTFYYAFRFFSLSMGVYFKYFYASVYVLY